MIKTTGKEIAEAVQAAILAELAPWRAAVRDYISECDNPVPDYNHRRTLRNRLRELGGCPPEPRRS